MNHPQKSADDRAGVGHGARSAAMRERAILSLLSERTIAKAARKSGVNEKTLRRWMSEDDTFRVEYATARHITFQAGMSRVQALCARAVDTLEELLDEKKHPHVRLGAARILAELAMHQHDADTITERLDQIEVHQRKLDATRR